MIYKSQIGDTIVEVLLAMAVVSSVLGGAYVAANRSVNANRSAQERAEAVKLVESQLERLKAATGDPAVFSDNVYCFDVSSGSVTPVEFSGPLASMPDIKTDDPGIYPASCVSASAAAYSLSVDKDTATNNFAVRARWDKAGGGSREETVIVYRVYQ